jgi:uncharacterized membrane protein YhaH (DUF805 family)
LFLLEKLLTDFSLSYFRPRASAWYLIELDVAYALPRIITRGMLIWPLIAVLAKRMHDLDRSGWWLLVLPAVAAALATAGTGRLVTSCLFWITIAILWTLPGTRGHNRFGADPSARA